MADQRAPLLEVGRTAEVDRVILERFPFDEQAIAAGLLDAALQLHALAAFGAAKDRRRLLHAALELILHAGNDVALRNLENHGLPPHLQQRCGISECLATSSLARSITTLACFQVASSCIFPSIITAPVPSGMAARIFCANAPSAGSGENTRLAIAICDGCRVQAPTQPIRKALRNWAAQPAGSEKSPNGP